MVVVVVVVVVVAAAVVVLNSKRVRPGLGSANEAGKQKLDPAASY